MPAKTGGQADGEPTHGAVEVRPAGRDHADADFAARLHVTQIDEGFLSSLGPRFVRALYRRITRTDGSFLLIALCDGERVGFVAGSVAVRRLYGKFLLHDGVVAALASSLRILRSWRQVMETLRHGGDSAAMADSGELLAIVVAPSSQSRHVGTELVAAFLTQLEAMGTADAHVVVGADNDAAVALYHRSGFVTRQRFEFHAGTTSLLLSRSAPVSPASTPTHPRP
jgi:ribosomal protein S18 acetylase RimI-like enzyme